MSGSADENWRLMALLPMPVEDVALIVGLPRAFVRLAIDCGCPSKDGLLSQIALFGWLVRHCHRFRAAAALPALPPSNSTDAAQLHQAAFRDMLQTIVDYRESRCSDPATKRALRELSVRIAAGQID